MNKGRRTKRLRAKVGFQNWEIEGVFDDLLDGIINRGRVERAVTKSLLEVLRLFFDDDGFSICVDDHEIVLGDSNNESGRIVAFPLSFMDVYLTQSSRDRMVANLAALQFADADDLVAMTMDELLKAKDGQ